jgi:hypothetical protein
MHYRPKVSLSPGGRLMRTFLGDASSRVTDWVRPGKH